jgi:hypothetical protein
MRHWGGRIVLETLIALYYGASAQIVSAGFLSMWGSAIGQSLPRWLNDTMERPFAYRVLSRWWLQWVLTHAPHQRLHAWLTKPLCPGDPAGPDCEGRVVDAMLARYRVPADLMVETFLVDLTQVFALFATAYVLRALLTHFRLLRALQLLLPGVFLLALPATFAGGGYIYDVPELLLAAVFTFALAKQRWLLLYPALTLAILNKEADVLLCGFCLLFALDRDYRRLAIHAGWCVAFGVLPFVMVRIGLQHRPGLGAVDHLRSNLHYLATLEPWLGRAHSYHPTLAFPNALNIVTSGLAVVLLTYRWTERPRDLRVLMLAVLALLLPLFLTYGAKNEIRVFGMIYPSMFVLASYSIEELLGVSVDRTAAQLGSEQALRGVAEPQQADFGGPPVVLAIGVGPGVADRTSSPRRQQ